MELITHKYMHTHKRKKKRRKKHSWKINSITFKFAMESGGQIDLLLDLVIDALIYITVIDYKASFESKK